MLHRDISINNIMFREEDDKISGVLNDYDMAVDSKRVEGGTSRQRTGTKQFLSVELHRPIPPTHSYRHDLESLAYCLLWMISKRVLKWDEEKEEYHFYLTHPLSYWEAASHEELKQAKSDLNDMPNPYSSFHFLFVKLSRMIRHIIKVNNANTAQVQEMDVFSQHTSFRDSVDEKLLATELGSGGAASQEEPAVLQFEDYTQHLFDANMEKLAGLIQSAPSNLQLAMLFKVER